MLLSACAPAWEGYATITGYAMCDDDLHTMTVTYESGPNIDSAKLTASETPSVVTVVVALQGSGAVPAIAQPATATIDLDQPLYDRSIITFASQPVPAGRLLTPTHPTG